MARTSSVSFNGSATNLTIDPGSSPFYKMTFTGTGGWSTANHPVTVSSTVLAMNGQFTVASGSTLTIAGNLTIGPSGALAVNADLGVNGGTISNAGTVTSDPSAVLTSSGTGTLGGTGFALWPSIVLAGSAKTTTLSAPLALQGSLTNNAGHTFDPSASNYSITVGGSWSNAGTYVTQASSLTLSGAGTGLTFDSGSNAIYKLGVTGSGAWSTSAHPLTVSTDVSLAAGSFTVASGATMTVAGDVDVQSGATLNLNANSAIQGGALTNAGTVNSVVGSTLALSGTGTLGGAGSTNLAALMLSGNVQTTTLGGNITVAGFLTNSAGHTLDANNSGNYTITISSNWTNVGTFTPETGTVVFNSTAVISGNSTFYNFTVITPGITLTFVAGSTQTVNGNFLLNGSNGALITLQSSASPTQFYINSQGSTDILYVSVKDSVATGNILNASASTDGGHNVNWTFGGSKTWVGSTSTSWNVAANWSPSGIPGALDSIIFNNSASRNCVVNLSTTVAQITIQSNFARSVTFNAGIALTLNGNFSQAAGTFNFSNPVTMTVGGSWIQTGGTFTSGAGTVVFNSNASGQTIRSNGRPFFNVTFNGAGGYWTLVDSLTVGGSLTLTAGTLDTSASGNLGVSVGGDWLNNGGAFVANNSTVVFNAGSAGHLITSNGNTFGSVAFSNAAGAWTLQDNLSLSGGLTLGAGTLSGGSATLSLAGDWNNTGGTFTAGTSTVTVTGIAGSTTTFSGSTTFNNLVCAVGGKTLRFGATLTQTVAGNLVLTGAAGNLLRLRSTSDSVNWFLNLSGNQNVAYVDVRDSNASGGGAIYAGKFSANSTGNTNWIFDFLPGGVADLTATAQLNGDVWLTWSAPLDADDNPLGSGSQYAIEWSTYAVVWSTANAGDTGYLSTNHIYLSTSTVNAGDPQIFVSTGLTGGVSYYFRLWTEDPQGYWTQSLSNGATTTVNVVLSVQLSTSSYNFGTVKMAATTVSTMAVIMTNVGNVTESYSLSASTMGAQTVWALTASTPTTMDHFAVFGVFNSIKPSSTTFESADMLTSVPTAASIDVYSGDQTAVSIPVLGQRSLWMRLDMPPYTSTENTQQFRLTVTAASP